MARGVNRPRSAGCGGDCGSRARRIRLIVLAVTGYPAGGVSPLGLPASVPVIVDAATAELRFAYGGGGQDLLLLRVHVSDVIRCNNALVADITEHPRRRC